MAKKTDEAKNMQAAMEAVDTVMKQVADDMGAVLVQSTENTPPPEETVPATETAPAVETMPTGEAAPTAAPVALANESGFYIYIGPNIKGLIQTGTIYRGDWANALKQAGAAIAKQPLVKTLIVSGDALPEARLKVKTPGNTLYTNYNRLKKPEGK